MGQLPQTEQPLVSLPVHMTKSKCRSTDRRKQHPKQRTSLTYMRDGWTSLTLTAHMDFTWAWAEFSSVLEPSSGRWRNCSFCYSLEHGGNICWEVISRLSRRATYDVGWSLTGSTELHCCCFFYCHKQINGWIDVHVPVASIFSDFNEPKYRTRYLTWVTGGQGVWKPSRNGWIQSQISGKEQGRKLNGNKCLSRRRSSKEQTKSGGAYNEGINHSEQQML